MIDFTRPEDIDLDASEKALLETFKRNEGNSLKIQSLKKRSRRQSTIWCRTARL